MFHRRADLSGERRARQRFEFFRFEAPPWLIDMSDRSFERSTRDLVRPIVETPFLRKGDPLTRWRLEFIFDSNAVSSSFVLFDLQLVRLSLLRKIARGVEDVYVTETDRPSCQITVKSGMYDFSVVCRGAAGMALSSSTIAIGEYGEALSSALDWAEKEQLPFAPEGAADDAPRAQLR